VTERLIPDLLHPVPMVRLALPELTRALGFAFAAAGSDVALYEQLGHASLAFSSWDPACFAEDLYLPELLQKIGHLELDGQRYEMHYKHLERLLSHPPDDLAVARFRQHTLRELMGSAEHVQSFQRIYVKLRAFRALLTESSLGYRIDAGRRRMDILEAGLSAVREMAASFEDASSALLRLREHGQALLAQEGFVRLAKILALDDGLARLDARLCVGYDGQLRHFEIVRISEDAHNPFYATRLGRIVRKLVMLVRGYRFSDYEVLNAFVDEVFHGVAGELVKFFQLMGDMEFYLAALRLSALSERAGLKVCLPELAVAAPGEALPRALHGLFNPHLLGETSGPVPCELVEPAHTRTLVLTGPNSGGKTRVLQALSLTQLLAQGGFVVPAREAKLVWARGMFLSISDHAAADQREGRLGTELLRIRRVFESMRLSAFVVLDELCSGTNPVEGEEIFRMVLELLRELEPQAFISTHFLQFAARLADDPGMAFLTFRQVELDAKNLPTYQFVPGVASASLAKETAARLGVTREELSRLVERQKRAASAAAPSG
jgi:DNA mismatch repair protein MutS2